MEEFVAAVGIVDQCSAGDALWDIMLPVVVANIDRLLAREDFKTTVLEQPNLNFKLLRMLKSLPKPGSGVSDMSGSDTIIW